MIISHKHKFIFFAIPKTGTHTVRQALREHLGPDDLEQVGLFVQKRFAFPELKDFTSGHVSANQIRPILGEETFNSYFKFAFVRNPFDRFVSYCSFMSRDNGAFAAQPKAFMKHVITQIKPADHLLYKPQNYFLVDTAGALSVDFIGRNESMQDSYNEICSSLGIPAAMLGVVNSSQHKPFMEYYDEETYALVADLYNRDIDLFGYR
ncbi:MAG: sulfotransferase family 2 domain-containing protein [Arenimonas sp.]